MKTLANDSENGFGGKRMIFDYARFFCIIFVGMVACWLVSQVFTIATTSPFNKRFHCWQSLKEIRIVLLSHKRSGTGVPFLDWQREHDRILSHESLTAQVCAYCKEYAKRVKGVVFKIRNVDGFELLIDPWGRPYNVDMLSRFTDEEIKKGLKDYTTGGVVVWSSGPNGINEYGNGDDILERPRSKMRMRGSRKYMKLEE